MNEITKRIAENLLMARKNSGMSQQKLADALGLHKNTVAFWEVQRWVYRKYCSDPTYLAGETEARKAHRGVWAGMALAPWEWRHRAR